MEYKGLIFTNHILERMNQRGIIFKDVYWTWAHPDKTQPAETKQAFRYSKQKDNKYIVVVAKKNEIGKWVVLTCWQKEVIGWKRKQPKLSFLKNMWRMIIGK